MMILKQFYLNCLAHASYLIGDERAQWAAVVDPQRDVDQYLTFAADHHVRIAHVFLTHFHADFIAGHIELRDRTGATIYLGVSPSNRRDSHFASCCAPTTSVAALGDGGAASRGGSSRKRESTFPFTHRGDTA